ncbi:MAG: MmpS family transport accessory protein [Candidatus Cloacimonadota bacterium]|nr:MmpS family transport accessory protein [Candidatus Cloacimonadota bacterium]
MKKLLFAFVILLVVLIGCSIFDFSIDVKYEVTGSANKVDVTYANKDEGTSQANDVSIPWSYSFEGEGDQFVYISAQNQGQSGSVTVTIYRDGKKFKRSTSTGAYCIASASGLL